MSDFLEIPSKGKSFPKFPIKNIYIYSSKATILRYSLKVCVRLCKQHTPSYIGAYILSQVAPRVAHPVHAYSVEYPPPVLVNSRALECTVNGLSHVTIVFSSGVLPKRMSSDTAHPVRFQVASIPGAFSNVVLS